MSSECPKCGVIGALHLPNCSQNASNWDVPGRVPYPPAMTGNPEAHDYRIPECRPSNEAGIGVIERVKLMREAGNVERCHVYPHLGSYSVGHHSYGVASLLLVCWEAEKGYMPSSRLLAAALLHDVSERITGDIPKPAKDAMGSVLRALDQRVADHVTPVILSPEEEDWLAVADRVELYLWCLEQARSGNTSFLDWVRHYDDHFCANPPPWPFLEIMRRAARDRMSQLSNKRLEEIAGL